MPARSDTRQRMIESATALFRERGVHGTSFADVLEHSGAPRGSVYYHFGGGKSQLASESIEAVGEFIRLGIRAAAEALPPHQVLELIRQQYSTTLVESEFRAGCPVAAAILDAVHEPVAAAAASRAIVAWEDELTTALNQHGVPENEARKLAEFALAAFEGSLILCRAKRSTGPLDRAFETLGSDLEEALRRTGV